MTRFIGLLGIAVMVGIAYAFSKDRRRINLRLILWGFGLQFVFALLILKTSPGRWVFDRVNNVIVGLLSCTEAGSSFVFGNLIRQFVPVGEKDAAGVFQQSGSLVVNNDMAYFAFGVLPTIIFFSALMGILYHYGIMQRVVMVLARIMSSTMGTSGAESLSAASNIFVGQTEAPLVIRPYVERMTNSELTAVMTAGFATIAGGVMAAYVGILREQIPDIAGHLMAASIMSAPAALVLSKIFYPEIEQPETAGEVKLHMEKTTRNGIDAAASGTTLGLKLALNVAAMLIAFLGLVQLVNILLGLVHDDLTLSFIFGKVLAPLAWLMGVPWEDAATFGDLLGTKVMINEFVAYAKLRAVSAQLQPKTLIIASYALCGFANLGSIGIQIGGISAIAAGRRSDLARLCIRAVVAGAFASFTTACIAGILI